MAEIKKPQKETFQKQARVYTELELQDFDNKVQRFYEDYTIQNGKNRGEVIRVLNQKKLGIAFGALDKRGAVIVDEVYGVRLHVLENLLEQWGKWKGKKQWVEKKRIEGLQEVADGMKIDAMVEDAYLKF